MHAVITYPNRVETVSNNQRMHTLRARRPVMTGCLDGALWALRVTQIRM